MSFQDQKLISLLQDMIRIPSWVGPYNNENLLVDYLEEWIKRNTSLQTFRQELPGGRFNLIAKIGEPDRILLGHTDTVDPHQGSPFGMFEATVSDGRVWGLGAADMKSGIAAMLQAVSIVNPENLWVMLYADEENDFLGMKGLVKEFSHLRPQMLISSDGSDLLLGHGCRGCIEFRMRVGGVTGHPARGTGNSAIWGGFQSLSSLEMYLSTFQHPVMGKTSFNVAHVNGGAMMADSLVDDRLIAVGQKGNVVPDVLEFVVDIRPATPELNLDKVLSFLEADLLSRGLMVKSVIRTHDLGAWYTDPELLGRFATSRSLENPKNSGYLDLQMLWEATGRPPALMFGGGAGNTAHTPQENIEIASLIKTRDFFVEILAD